MVSVCGCKFADVGADGSGSLHLSEEPEKERINLELEHFLIRVFIKELLGWGYITVSRIGITGIECKGITIFQKGL